MNNQLHYRGDQTRFDPDAIFGPDIFRAFYRVVGSEYDAETDLTTLTFVPIPPAELQERLVRHMEGVTQRGAADARLVELYGETA